LTSQPSPDIAKRDNGEVRDGFALSKDGQLMVTRDRETRRVVQEFVLTNGTHLYPNGDIIYYTGDREHMQPNELLTLDGMIEHTPITAKGIAPLIPPGAKNNDIVGISSQDGITVSGSDVFVTRNGVMEKIAKPFQLACGVVMKPDGSFTTKDGQNVILRENQILGFDGKLKESRIQETAPAVAPVASPEKASR
jgi:hypothetical protein